MNAVNILTALTLVQQLLAQAQGIGALIHGAQSEGRDLTDAELDSLLAADTAAKQALADAIAKARS